MAKRTSMAQQDENPALKSVYKRAGRPKTHQKSKIYPLQPQQQLHNKIKAQDISYFA